MNAIDGTLVYKPKEFRFNGKTDIVALASSKLENYNLKDRLVILGNDSEARLEAINKGAGMYCCFLDRRN
ncbi:hypothetical protein MGH68_08185 [Erysipelothrix sp. D19-032]